MINLLYRLAGSALSPRGSGARLSILIYHRVLPGADDPLMGEPGAQSFDAQMGLLRTAFNVLPLGEAVERLKAGSLPPRAACITFDDGYADNISVALPILRRHSLPATFFVATAYLDGGRMFHDTIIHGIQHSQREHLDLAALGLGTHELGSLEAKRRALGAILRGIRYDTPPERREDTAAEIARLASDIPPPDDLMMDSRQLRDLADAGMEIGGHTANHPILARVDAAAARREIADGRDRLEALLGGAKVKLFAYPNGKPGVDYRPEHVDMVRELGFQAAVSTHAGTTGRHGDIFQMPRFTPHRAKGIQRFTPMLLHNLTRRGQ